MIQYPIIEIATVFSSVHLSNGIQLAQPSTALARVIKEGRHVTYFHCTSNRTLNRLGFLRRVRYDKPAGLTGGGETTQNSQDGFLHRLALKAQQVGLHGQLFFPSNIALLSFAPAGIFSLAAPPVPSVHVH